jgi:hypothetical protein
VPTPIRWRLVENVVELDAGLQLLQLLPQHDILLSLVAEQQYHLYVLVGHLGYLADGLVAGSDAAAASDKKYSFESLFFPLYV